MSTSSHGTECGPESFHLAKYVMEDLGQGDSSGQCPVLSRSSFTEGLPVCARAAVIIPFEGALATEPDTTPLPGCPHPVTDPRRSTNAWPSWSQFRNKPAVEVIVGLPQAVWGPLSQLYISLCSILIPSPSFHRHTYQENSLIVFCRYTLFQSPLPLGKPACIVGPRCHRS